MADRQTDMDPGQARQFLTLVLCVDSECIGGRGRFAQRVEAVGQRGIPGRGHCMRWDLAGT